MSQNIANSVLLQKPNRGTHNLTSETKTTGKIGQLYPILVQEVVPGDNVKITADFLTKLQPLATPAMQNMNACVHYFYVPFRILWPNWKYFIAQTNNPFTNAPALHPTIDLDATQVTNNWLAPYLGINAAVDGINPFPFLAYQLIWNEYYRHQKVSDDLTPELVLTDGANNFNNTWNVQRRRTFKDDYFTAALESPQDGNQALMDFKDLSPIPVKRNANTPGGQNPQSDFQAEELGTSLGREVRIINALQGGGSGPILPNALWVDPNDGQFTIAYNDLIELSRMQEFLVRNNLAGNRYNEFILAHFGIRVPDLRVDRPEYITGVKAPIIISELLNTATEQGTQTGQGNGYGEGSTKNYYVQEHGIIMGLYSCISERSYVNAVQKLMFKKNPMDYFLPVFDQMGEQEIFNEELTLTHANPKGTFGYVPRYAEYRLPFNLVTGEFATTLTDWHLGLIPPNNVALNEAFFDMINQGRIFAINQNDVDTLLIQVINHVYIDRPLPVMSMPIITNNNPNRLS
ncbi:MAG: major capsid protein [Microvirus sp.]|nr:MAG: major capsid protein [Microvirus sp.]